MQFLTFVHILIHPRLKDNSALKYVRSMKKCPFIEKLFPGIRSWRRSIKQHLNDGRKTERQGGEFYACRPSGAGNGVWCRQVDDMLLMKLDEEWLSMTMRFLTRNLGLIGGANSKCITALLLLDDPIKPG